MNVWVAGRKLQVEPAQAIGKGGEADVYDIGAGLALKLFKPPDHPDLAGDPLGQEAARTRIEEQQQKLRAFPGSLPSRVVSPQDLVTTRHGGRVLGYTMRLLSGAELLLRYGERAFRQTGVSGDEVARIFRDLHQTVSTLHRQGVVLGDFNDLNVLVQGQQAHLIDADSFQFGGFLCRVFSERFVDPLLCDPAAGRPILRQPHNAHSDWYAFNAMLMRSLLFVDPYGGVYAPGPQAPRIHPAARPLHRITVFHPQVRYPKPALPLEILPDDLLQHFHLVFEKDRRGEFTPSLLDGLRFTRCTVCGSEHARATCPTCRAAAPAALREATTVRGQVRASRVFATRGSIVEATVQDGRLRLLVEEDGVLKREDGRVVLAGHWGLGMRARLSGERTLLARGGSLVTLEPDRSPERRGVDSVGTVPSFDTSASVAYWVDGGCLWREGRLGPERIGDVLPGQTRFWVGPRFGFGFYRAGELFVAFAFDGRGHALNDGVRLPRLSGQLLDANAVFGDDRCFFFTATQESGRTVNRCLLIRADGTVEASAEAEAGDASWLAGVRGSCASGRHLFAPTDDGVVRVEAVGGDLQATKAFPDTEPFVDADCRLLAAKDGLFVVGRQQVRLLRVG